MAWNEIGNNSSQSNGGSQIKYAKLPVGVTTLRVRDAEPKSRWVHWIPQANGGKGCSIDCIGKGCPVCSVIAEDKRAKRKSKYSSSKSHAINVLVKSHKPSPTAQPTAINEVQILDKGNKIFGGLLAIMQQMGDLRNYDVTITRVGEELGNIQYTVLPVFGSAPLTAEEESMTLYNLSELGKLFTKEQIVQLMNGATIESVTGTSETSSPLSSVPSNVGVDFTQAI